MIRLFSKPVFDDFDKSRKALILYNLVLGSDIIMSITELLMCIIMPHNIVRWLLIVFFYNLLTVFLLYVNRKGYYKVAAYLFVFSLFLFVTILSWFAGGIKAPAIHNFPAIVLAVGIILGWRKGLISGIIAAIIGFVFVLADFNGILPISNVIYNPFSLWLNTIISIALLSLLQYVTVEGLNKAMNSLQAELVLRKKIEAELRESEVFRTRVFDSSRIPIVVMNAETHWFIDCNQAAIDIYGYTSRIDILTKRPIDVSSPTQFDGTPSSELTDFYVNKAKSNGSVQFEWRHQRPNGELWDAEVHLMSFESNGKEYLQFTLLDISERKKTEQALLKSENQFQFISENTDDILWTYSFAENRFTYISASIFKLRGFTPDEVLKQSFDDALTPESIAYVNSIIHSIIENRTNDTSIVYKNLSEIDQYCKDGSIIKTEVSTSLQLDKNGMPYNVIGITRDITERKLAEQRLKESEQLFKNIIHYAPFPIVLAEFDTTYVIVNKAFCDLNELTEEEAIGKTAFDLGFVVEDEYIKKIENELQTKGDINGLEIKVTDRKGRKFDFLLSSSIIQWKNKSMFLNITIDITNKKKVEIELEQYRNQLELLVKERTEELGATVEELHSANEDLFEQKEELENTINALHVAQNQLVQQEKMASLGLLSAGIAHEINNPLNFISGGSLAINSYLNDNCKEHFDEIKPLLEAINTGVSRASEIVTSLSHYSRKDDLPFAECKIHSIIDNCLVMLQNQLKNKVEVRRKYSKNLQTIFANEGKLHQAMLNIISNAEQSIENTGIITIETELQDSNIIIKITDTGSGISEDDLQKIYDPFFTTKAPGKGTGLGLSITFNIIKEHKGTILYQSELQKGTTAIVTLPIKTSKI